jgi:hypothetical protein
MTISIDRNLSRFFQDYITLAGFRSPGVARFVKRGHRPRDFDVRKGYGFAGAFVVYTGDNLAKFSVQLECWNPPDLHVEWLFFSSILDKAPQGLTPALTSAFALGIGHPLINEAPLRINSVVIEDFSAWDVDEYGLWTMTIDFLEFKAPLPALGKPDKTIPSFDGGNAEQSVANFGGDTSPGAAAVASATDDLIDAMGP